MVCNLRVKIIILVANLVLFVGVEITANAMTKVIVVKFNVHLLVKDVDVGLIVFVTLKIIVEIINVCRCRVVITVNVDLIVNADPIIIVEIINVHRIFASVVLIANALLIIIVVM